MKQALINLGLLILVFVAAFLLGVPAIRIYDAFYSDGWGGTVAYLTGVLLSLLFLTPLLFGLRYRTWYKSKLYILIIVLVIWLTIDSVINFTEAKYLFPALLISGYLIGFTIRKVFDYFWYKGRTAPTQQD